MNANDVLFEKVKKLKLPSGEYALFGSAPLGVRGLRECRDVDIIVSEDLWDEYKNKFNNDGDIELWKDWAPGQWNIAKLIKEAEIIDDLPFVKLEQVIEWKKLNGREKDLRDVEVAEKYLRDTK